MDDDDFAELFKKLPSRSSWHDVASEFEALGKTLGDALRTAWQRRPTTSGSTAHARRCGR